MTSTPYVTHPRHLINGLSNGAVENNSRGILNKYSSAGRLTRRRKLPGEGRVIHVDLTVPLTTVEDVYDAHPKVFKNHHQDGEQWEGPCPHCGGDDRFVIVPDGNYWICRGCERDGKEKYTGRGGASLMMFIHRCSYAHAIRKIKRMKIVKHFDYPDEHGNDNVRAVRIEEPGKPKKLRMEHRGPDGWAPGENGSELGLFQWHDAEMATANGDWVFVTEGENKARMLHRRGLGAVSAPHGTGGVKVYANGAAHVMQGAKVAILPDNNDPGTSFAKKVAQSLRGIASRIRIVDPATWGDEGKDVANWLIVRHDDDSFVHGADELMRIVRKTKDWSPDKSGAVTSHIPVVAWDEVEPDRDTEFCVDPILPKHGSVLAYGKTKVGKGFWALDIAWHIAANMSYYGHDVEGGVVVYICLEGQHGIKNRIEAIKRKHDVRHIPFYLVTVPLKLADDVGALIAAVEDVVGGQVPVVVFVDTVNRSIHGSEFSDEVMAEYIAAVDAMVDRWNGLVVLIHHEGLAENRPRGHTSLPGAVDGQLHVEGDRRGHIWVTVDYMRDGPTGTRIDLWMEKTDIGVDKKGKKIDVMAVVRGEWSEDETPGPDPLSEHDKLTMAALRQAISDDESDDDGGADVAAWRQLAYAQYPGRQQRRDFWRSKKKLMDLSMVDV